MKIAFVVTPIISQIEGRYVPAYMDGLKSNPHVAPYLLSAILKREGYSPVIYDLVASDFLDFADIAADLANFDIVCFSVTSFNYSTACIILKKLKDINKDIITIIGGIHVSILGKEILGNNDIDYALAGEGEIAFPKLIKAIVTNKGGKNVPGLIYRGDDGTRVSNLRAPFLSATKLKASPVPAFEYLPQGVYRSLSIESSRGCNSHCTFCAAPHHKSWRCLDPGTFVNNIAEMLPLSHSTLRKKSFAIVDDCFTTDPQRVIEIIKLLEKKIGAVELSFDARAIDLVKEPEMVRHFAPFCNSLLIGAESCDDATLKRIRKPVTKEILLKATKILYENKIAHKAVFSVILYFPWETLADCKRTVKFFSDLVASYGITVFFQWFMLLPRSILWQTYCDDKKLGMDLFEAFDALTDNRLFFFDNMSDSDLAELCELLSVLKVVFATMNSSDNLYQDKIQFSIPRLARPGPD